MTHSRLSRVVFAIVLVLATLAPTAAVAAGAETATTTATAGSATTSDDVMNIVRGGPDVAESEARLVYDYLASHDVSTEFTEAERQRIYRWLLKRQTQTNAHVPSRFVTQVGETMSPTVVETIRGDVLPESSQSSGDTATATPTSGTSSSSSSDASTATTETANGSDAPVAIVDENLHVVSYSYNSSAEMFHVTFQNVDDREDSKVTVTEVVDRDEKGTSKFGIVQDEIEAGERKTIHVSASRVDGSAGVMVTSVKSVEKGEGTLIQESDDENIQLIKGGASGAHVRSAATFTFGGAVLFIVLGAWQFVAARNRDVQDADLDPGLTLLGQFRRLRR